MAVLSAGPYANNLHLAPDRQGTRAAVFRAAVSVPVGLRCPALLIVSMQMCILLYYWANKMMMRWR